MHWLVLTIPRKWGYWIGVRVADLDYLCRWRMRKAVRENLRYILTNVKQTPVSESLLTAQARAVFRNFAKYLVDFFSFARFNADNIHDLVKVKGLENVQQAFARDKGVVGVTAHLGNWELAATVVALLGFPISAVTLSHENTRINRLFVNQRVIKGVEVVPVGARPREYLNVLHRKRLIALAGDRVTSGVGIKVDFMGRPTEVPRGPAVLSLRTGAPILLAIMVRNAEDKFTLFFEPPIYPDSNRKGLAEAEKETTQKIMAILERYIREYPSQWFVFYRVWPDK